MKTRLTTAAVLFAAVVLTACGGGGGGGGGGGAPPTTPPPVVSPPAADPPRPARNPVSTIGALDISSTNPASGGSTAEFALGTPDPWFMPGGSFERENDGYSVTDSIVLRYENALNLLHRRVESPSSRGLTAVRGRFTLRGPSTAVRNAWMAGWTGRGVNVMLIDAFGVGGATPPPDSSNTHGYSVALSAMSIAIAANYYTLNGGLRDSGFAYRAGGLRNLRTDALADKSTRIDVINLSFGAPAQSSGIYVRQIEAYRRQRSTLFNDISGRGEYPNSGDAVIVTSAGNDALDAEWSPSNSALVRDRHTGPRTLIVGALSGNRLATISNFAGDHQTIYRRFLVADGRAALLHTSQLCDSAVISTCRNRERLGSTSIATSHAAPKVSGYAALVRHKFPNLTGAKTASILLETATTMGLACHPAGDTARKSPSCSRSIYGQGRVDIGAALVPVGGLR